MKGNAILPEIYYYVCFPRLALVSRVLLLFRVYLSIKSLLWSTSSSNDIWRSLPVSDGNIIRINA